MRAHRRRSNEPELAHVCNGHLLDFWHRHFGLPEYAVYAREVEIWETEEEMKVKLAGHSVKDEFLDPFKNTDDKSLEQDPPFWGRIHHDGCRGITVLVRQRKTGANDAWSRSRPQWIHRDIWRGMMLQV